MSGLTFDDVLAATGGHVLACRPAGGFVGASAVWDWPREHLDRSTRRRLVAAGMMGVLHPAGAVRHEVGGGVRPAGSSRLRGAPVAPDVLGQMLAASGRGPEDPWLACEWFVGACLAVLREQQERAVEAPPEGADLPGWVAEWLSRLVCPVKAEFVRAAAESVYAGGPGPVECGRSWEARVWGRLGRRVVAERGREDRRLEGAASAAGVSWS